MIADDREIAQERAQAKGIAETGEPVTCVNQASHKLSLCGMLSAFSRMDHLSSPIEIMRFTLIYDGPLPSAGNTSRTREKWEIRQKLHPQLDVMWRDHPAVQGWLTGYSKAEEDAHRPPSDTSELLSVFAVGDERFVPLVTRRLDMTCHLNILFLRCARPGGLVGGDGDIDNRLKVLFDALRIPQRESELMQFASPLPKPYFCLLEDDSLISGFQVKTEQLFYPVPESREAVRLTIEVQIQVQRARYGTLSLLGD